MGALEVPVTLGVVGQNRLYCSGGGTFKIIPLPVKPFRIVEASDTVEGAQFVKLVGGGSAYINKEEFDTIPASAGAGTKVARLTMDYVLELIKEHPDKVRELLDNSIDPYPIFLDIETMSTDTHFSKAERDQILSIQLKYRDHDTKVFLNRKMTRESEVDMLMETLDYMTVSPSGKSPDFVVGYFINKFDTPYIKTRVRLNSKYAPELSKAMVAMGRGPVDEFGRRGTISYPRWTFSGMNDREDIEFSPGLPNLDLFVHVKTDQNLVTLPNKGLKAVTIAYGGTVFDISSDEKSSMDELLLNDTERFMTYAKSDISATEFLYDIYETRLVAASNLLTCPISMVHRMSSGQKSYLALYRECRKNSYFALTRNEKRYEDLYKEADKYQGAIVDCYRRGYFDKTVYLDAKSLYPNIMHDFNISYDRYRVTGEIPYDKWPEEFEGLPEDANIQMPLDQKMEITPCIVSFGPVSSRTIYVPDDNYETVFKFECDFSSDGFIRKMIDHYNGVRDEFKKRAKEYQKEYRETNDANIKRLYMNYDAIQAEAKIVNNTFYGIQGNRYYDIADLPAAIFVTSMGRWTMTEMVRLFGKKAIIEIDTDGLLLDRNHIEVDIGKLNSIIRKRTSDFFGIPEKDLNFLLEFEDEGSVYMYKRKNYILRKDSDPTKLYPKGSSFKGYDKAEILHRAVGVMADAIMFRSADPQEYMKALAKARDIHGVYKREGRGPFKFSKTLKRHLSEYKGYRNAEAAIFNLNIDPTKSRMPQLKQNAIDWISLAFSGSDKSTKERAKELKSSVRSCRNEDQLRAVAKHLTSMQPAADRKKGVYFIMDIIERMQKNGQTVEVDDTIEYYYTLTKEQYTLESEMTPETKLNLRKYQDEIESVIERFSFADPRRIALSFDDLLMNDEEDTGSMDLESDDDDEEEESEWMEEPQE